VAFFEGRGGGLSGEYDGNRWARATLASKILLQNPLTQERRIVGPLVESDDPWFESDGFEPDGTTLGSSRTEKRDDPWFESDGIGSRVFETTSTHRRTLGHASDASHAS
jgi:hypothetical protein